MSQRQMAFRADFRTRITPAYYGWAHVVLVYALGIAAIWYCARPVANPAWYEYLVIPVLFCVSNVFEWWIHRYVMHRLLKGFIGIYKRHTLAHYQFFTHIDPTIALHATSASWSSRPMRWWRSSCCRCVRGSARPRHHGRAAAEGWAIARIHP
jgi:hypothetical protein